MKMIWLLRQNYVLVIFWGGFLVFRVFLGLLQLFVFLITSWTVIDNNIISVKVLSNYHCTTMSRDSLFQAKSLCLDTNTLGDLPL